MAKRKVDPKNDETILDIVEARDNIQDYINNNKGLIIGLIAALLLLVAGYFVWKYAIVAPRETAAIEQISKAQEQFAKDSFALALTNPGAGFEGFVDIAENYGGTATANTAKYYAGVSYLNLGRYEDALEYLSSVKAKGDILPVMKHGNLGDVHSELGAMDKAQSSYKKAINSSENAYLKPYYMNKLALLHMKEGRTTDAQKLFAEIKADYPESSVAQEVDKFLIK